MPLRNIWNQILYRSFFIVFCDVSVEQKGMESPARSVFNVLEEVGEASF